LPPREASQLVQPVAQLPVGEATVAADPTGTTIVTPLLTIVVELAGGLETRLSNQYCLEMVRFGDEKLSRELSTLKIYLKGKRLVRNAQQKITTNHEVMSQLRNVLQQPPPWVAKQP
jgi:hypothetical protein